MNKSQVSRDFWRKIFDENKIDLRNSDKRNAAVNEFLENPQNIKSGWKKSDRRFFRLSLDKIFRERGISSHTKNIKPIAQTAQKQAGSMRMNIKTDEKRYMRQNRLHLLLITVAAGFSMCLPLATMTVSYSVCPQQHALFIK